MRGDEGLLVFRVKWEFGQEKGNALTSNKSKSDDHDVAVAGLHQGEEWKYRAESFNRIHRPHAL